MRVFVFVLVAGGMLGALAAACTHTEQHIIDVPVDRPEGGSVGLLDAGFDSAVSPEAGLGILKFRPSTLYSGFDGTHAFTVPIAIYDSDDDLTITVSDSATAEVTPKKLVNPTKNGITDNGKYFFVALKQAGEVTLTATSAGETTTATITITPYAADRWGVGQARYTTQEGTSPPCTQCHGGAGGIDHSPAALATATDSKIAATIVTGIDPFGTRIEIDGQPSHKWQVTDDEKSGLVTYLRALEPRGFE